MFFKKPNDARQIVLGGYVLVPAPSRATTLVKKNVSLIRKFIKANKAGGGITGMALTAAAGAVCPSLAWIEQTYALRPS